MDFMNDHKIFAMKFSWQQQNYTTWRQAMNHEYWWKQDHKPRKFKATHVEILRICMQTLLINTDA